MNNNLLNSNQTHYRLAKHSETGTVSAVQVQEFDYPDYEFVNETCFSDEESATAEARKHNRKPILSPCCGAPIYVLVDHEGNPEINCDRCLNDWDSKGQVGYWQSPVS